MPTIAIPAGSTSEPIEVGPGTRISSTGGYVQWTAGTLADARNGVATWRLWPAGATAATEDALRRMVIRGVATGAMTLTWDEAKRDEGPDGAYWQDSVPAWSVDSAGNVAGLVGPGGGVTPLGSGPSASASAADQTAQMQLAIRGGSLSVAPGAYTLTEPLLLGSNTSIEFSPGVTISNGVSQHTMLRTGNADFSAADGPIPGVSIYCADEQSAGVGTLRYTHSGTTLAWLAPGESSYGSEVSIAAVVSVATSAVLIVPAASSGKALYVFVTTAAARNANISRSVRVESVTGAKAMTWTRASNVRTVTETGHGRRTGDFVINFGPSGDVSFGYITAVAANTYTLADTGTDQGVAQSGRAFGVRDVRIKGGGAVLNHNKPAFPAALMSHLHSVILLACNDVDVYDLEVNNTTKYAILAVGFKDLRLSCIRSYRNTSSTTDGNSDTIHVSGPGVGFWADNVRAQAGDNILGIGCNDYKDYQFNMGAYGDLSLVDGYVLNVRCEDSHQHPVRFFNAPGTNFIRNWVVEGVYGTYTTDADAAVAVIADANAMQIDPGTTNIDGLTIISPDAVRTDGSASYAVSLGGAGTRRGVRAFRVRPRACTSSVRGVVWVHTGTSVSDLEVEFSAGDFSGYLVALTGTANVGRLTVRSAGQLNGNNELGGGFPPALVGVDSSTSVVGYLDVSAIVADDTSSTGTKLRGLFNTGTVTDQSWSDIRMLDGDALVRNATTAAAGGTIRARGVLASTAFGLVFDGGMAGTLDIQAFNHASVSNAIVQNADPTARTIRVRAVGCRGGNRFLRNVQGGHTWLISGYGNEPGGGAAVVTDAGTPSWRLDGDWDLVTDGALLDATVTNHRAGAKFYNSNAAFGAGVGAYVRGASAWVRVAA